MSTSSAGRRLTLRDIADEAGVSVPTVSKVVKGRPDVSAQLRARIESLLKERGYTPRQADDDRSSSRSRGIELHFDSMESTNNLQIMQGVLDAAEEVDTAVVVKITPKDFQGASWVNSVRRAHHDGLILVTSRLDDEQQSAFAEAGIPIVVIDPINAPRPPIASVGVNNYTGGYLATSHLIRLGHRRIATIRGVASECANARTAGYRAALQEAGIPLAPAYEVDGFFRYDDGRNAALQLLRLDEPPTAIFAANDLEALGAIDAARKLSLRVPEELSVVGFDDSLQAITAAPRLTTVRQPLREIGATAFSALMQIKDGKQLPTHRLELSTELIVRESSTTYAG